MNANDVVRLQGKTRKGKNVVRNHGTEWKVITLGSIFSKPLAGTYALIESIDPATGFRWINAEGDDPDFNVEIIQ